MRKEIEKAGEEVNVVRDVEYMTKGIFGKIEKLINPKKRHRLTFGQKSADFLTKWAGSWVFIIGFFIFLAIWMFINTMWLIFGKAWDIYPFILLNLILSCLAAIQAPIILMSQNRSAQRDRIKAEFDYKINIKAEKEIQEIIKKLNTIERKLR